MKNIKHFEVVGAKPPPRVVLPGYTWSEVIGRIISDLLRYHYLKRKR